MPLKSVEELLNLFDKIRQDKKNHWMVRCPSHNDGERLDQFSLSITALPDKILINCLAGCNINAVLGSLKLEMGDLFLNSTRKGRASFTGNEEIDKTYDYHSLDGKVLFQVVRLKPKAFRQRRPDGAGGWIWNLTGIKPVLYHLPEVTKAITAGETIYLCEGEKDADNLISFTGKITTTSPMGAGKWKKSYTDMLKGASLVIIATDNDASGLNHANIVADNLTKAGVIVKLLQMPRVGIKDISDWISEGLTLDDLKDTINKLPPFVAPPIQLEAKKKPWEKYNLTDYGNAERLVALYGDIVRYSPQRKAWLIWTGKVWEWDIGSVRISKLAKKTSRNIYHEAAEEEDDDLRKSIVKHAAATERQVRLDAMVKSAESEEDVAITVSSLDANHWLLNVNNGTIDLKTGNLNPHNSADLITVILDIEYSPEATSEEWDAFIRRIFNADEELMAYVQRGIGYSITGDQSEQVFFFCYGSGFNGKSTLLNACRMVMDSYATQIPPTAFMVDKTKRGGADEAIASLVNKRLVCSTELEDGQRLSVSLIKRMTGGEPLWCEHKFERGYNFQPTHKLWLSGNHEPVITDTTNSIWNRLKKIPFLIAIPEEERRKGYSEYLVANYTPAILTWMVKGCIDWMENGTLGEPELIKKAVNDYRNQQDILHDYLEECCVMNINAVIDQKSLYLNYKKWADENNIDVIGKLTFRNRLQEKGMKTDYGNRHIAIWRGITLVSDLPEDDNLGDSVNLDNSVNQNVIKPLHEASIEKPLQKTVNKVTTITTENKPSTPDDGNLSQSELKIMLEKYTNLTINDLINQWLKQEKPVIKVVDGVFIPDIEHYINTDHMTIEGISAISNWAEIVSLKEK